MAQKKSVLQNLKERADFHGFLRGSMFIKYPKVTADDAVEAFNTGREAVFKRARINSDAAKAIELEAFLNQMAEAASFETQVDALASRILERMESKATAGLNAGINGINTKSYGLQSEGGLSYSNISSAAHQALKVWEYGNKVGKQQTQIAGAKGGGDYNNYTEGSAYDFLNQLNTGTPQTIAAIQKIGYGYKQLGNLTGELLERVLEAVGNSCWSAGSDVAEQAINEVLASFGTMDISQTTVGQVERHVELKIGDKTGAVMFDSQGKVDVKIPFSDGTTMAISAKSRQRLSQEVDLLTNANLMGLLAGAGVATSREGYSALTVYTGGANYSQTSSNATFSLMKKMLVMQALSGTTGMANDLANYMVFQVGQSKGAPHFKVINISNFMTDTLDLTNDINSFVKLEFNPNPLPMGANTYIENYKSEVIDSPGKETIRYPRTEATLNKLFSAQVSVSLKSGFLSKLYGIVN